MRDTSHRTVIRAPPIGGGARQWTGTWSLPRYDGHLGLDSEGYEICDTAGRLYPRLSVVLYAPSPVGLTSIHLVDADLPLELREVIYEYAPSQGYDLGSAVIDNLGHGWPVASNLSGHRYQLDWNIDRDAATVGDDVRLMVDVWWERATCR